jgi:predicted enzyme related to lactoylglutathione lyase
MCEADTVVVHRIIPNLKVDDAGAGHAFYAEFLGLEKEFDLGWVASFRDPENRSIQVSLVSADATAPEDSVMTVHVADVDTAYGRARELGYEIVYPLTDEPWGVRRFFVRDPHGHVVNVARHHD